MSKGIRQVTKAIIAKIDFAAHEAPKSKKLQRALEEAHRFADIRLNAEYCLDMAVATLFGVMAAKARAKIALGYDQGRSCETVEESDALAAAIDTATEEVWPLL